MTSSAGRWRPWRGRPATEPRSPLRVGGRVAALLSALTLAPATGAAAQEVVAPQPVAEAIRQRVDQLRESGELRVGGVRVDTAGGLVRLYEGRAFRPLWSDAAARELLRFVRGVEADGLRPEHYHVDALAEAGSGPGLGPERAAEVELLRSGVLLAVASDLARGRVDPRSLDARWGVSRPDVPLLDPDSLAVFVARGQVIRALDRLRPQHAIYRNMMAALATYRDVAARGGWPAVPEGTFLEVDSAGPAVPLLRRRLTWEGDLPRGTDTLSATFDSTLHAGVRRFQHRHGLNDDGVVGAATLAALNVPVETRVAQLRLNLERARWALRQLAHTFVAVNVAGQRVYVMQGDTVPLEMRAVVGKDYTRTPVFSAPMRYLVLNPTWTVPRSINGEILANIRRDPAYLERQGMQVLDEGGSPMDPGQVDFQRYTGGSFPYVFRQLPGPTNALGHIKFMFPNPFNVYLHDTPSRSLFAREERLFSHGCIRVEQPLALAALLLDGLSADDVERAIATGETRIIDLPQPVPVLVLYWTAATDLHGEVHFYRDIYGRDAALLDALDREDTEG